MQRKIIVAAVFGVLAFTMLLPACTKEEEIVPTDADVQVVDSISEEELQREALGNYDPDAVRYTKEDTALYSEPKSDSQILGSIIQFSQVEFIEEKALENGEIWSKVRYVIVNQFVEGWVPRYTLTGNIGDDFREAFRNLDFTPQYKTSGYENNPKIDVKAIYVSRSSAITNIDRFIEIAKETKINAFVIDVKDDYGYMLFNSSASEKFAPGANVKSTLSDDKIKELMRKLKENDIYTIARIVTFKDTVYVNQYPERIIVYKNGNVPYKSTDNLYWASPHDRQLWEYDVEVAKEAADYGFNEIQFDYVRFPALSKSMEEKIDFRNTEGESEAEAIQKFLKYAYEELSKKEVYVAADIYGQVGSVSDDMGIGQYWEAVSNVIDYVSPMMYPSHYGNNVYGLSVPDAYPYETIYYCTRDSIKRNKNISTPAEIRPWIQDFTAKWVKGYIPYGVNELKAQIKALEDLGINQYMIWNPSNKYSVGALK